MREGGKEGGKEGGRGMKWKMIEEEVRTNTLWSPLKQVTHGHLISPCLLSSPYSEGEGGGDSSCEQAKRDSLVSPQVQLLSILLELSQERETERERAGEREREGERESSNPLGITLLCQSLPSCQTSYW